MQISQRTRRLYEQQVRKLPIGERLQLVKLVIEELENAAMGLEEADWSALSLEQFQREWDNADDAVYDDWREAYGISTG